MTLDLALRVLADVHTRDDLQFGFIVSAGAHPYDHLTPWSPSDYLEAWRVVRAHLGLQVEPEK